MYIHYLSYQKHVAVFQYETATTIYLNYDILDREKMEVCVKFPIFMLSCLKPFIYIFNMKTFLK